MGSLLQELIRIADVTLLLGSLLSCICLEFLILPGIGTFVAMRKALVLI